MAFVRDPISVSQGFSHRSGIEAKIMSRIPKTEFSPISSRPTCSIRVSCLALWSLNETKDEDGRHWNTSFFMDGRPYCLVCWFDWQTVLEWLLQRHVAAHIINDMKRRIDTFVCFIALDMISVHELHSIDLSVEWRANISFFDWLFLKISDLFN